MMNERREESMDAKRLQNCLRELRKRASDKVNEKGEVIVKKEEWEQYKLHIVSENNFPTAAGLASSASGFACLVYTVAQLYGIKEQYPGELSQMARQGSGSACRSLYGGWVKWEAGVKADGSDSIAVQVAPEQAWPDMAILILVVSSHRKPIGSTDAMQRSVETSELLKYRADHIVPARMKRMEQAILAQDFDTFAKETMQDSNQFHATCLDTYPPVFYLNDVSKQIIHVLTRYNQFNQDGTPAAHLKAAYTFDAGPNAVIYAPKQYVPEILGLVHHYFPFADASVKTASSSSSSSSSIVAPSEALIKAVNMEPNPAALERIIHTRPGPGPQVLSEADSLISAAGLPKSSSN
jgi:diphosphomevalonate decarboxylase